MRETCYSKNSFSAIDHTQAAVHLVYRFAHTEAIYRLCVVLWLDPHTAYCIYVYLENLVGNYIWQFGDPFNSPNHQVLIPLRCWLYTSTYGPLSTNCQICINSANITTQHLGRPNRQNFWPPIHFPAIRYLPLYLGIPDVGWKHPIIINKYY